MKMELCLVPVEPPSISDKAQVDLQVLAIEGYPFEVCGAIYTHEIIVQYPNTFSGDHRKGFDMEIDLHRDIKAIWHSHPGGLTTPSQDDLPCIKFLTEHGYTFHHIIVTHKAVFEYRAELVDQSAA